MTQSRVWVQNAHMAEGLDLTDDERRALDALVPPDLQTGDVEADLVAAAREAVRRRRQNTLDGGAVLRVLHRGTPSWRRVATKVGGMSYVTFRRWGVAADEAAEAADNDDGPALEDRPVA